MILWFSYEGRIVARAVDGVHLVTGIQVQVGGDAGSEEGHVGRSARILGVVEDFELVGVSVSEELGRHRRFEAVDDFAVLAAEHSRAVGPSRSNVRHDVNLLSFILHHSVIIHSFIIDVLIYKSLAAYPALLKA